MRDVIVQQNIICLIYCRCLESNLSSDFPTFVFLEKNMTLQCHETVQCQDTLHCIRGTCQCRETEYWSETACAKGILIGNLCLNNFVFKI